MQDPDIIVMVSKAVNFEQLFNGVIFCVLQMKSIFLTQPISQLERMKAGGPLRARATQMRVDPACSEELSQPELENEWDHIISPWCPAELKAPSPSAEAEL